MNAGELRLGRLLPGRAGGRDRRRPRAGRAGARRQPGGRLQQGPVREGRRPRTHRRLDVGRPPRRREGDHRPGEQGVRPGVPRRRQRDHGVGVRGDALGGRRRDPEQRQHARRRSTRRRASARSRRSPTSARTARCTSTSSPTPASPGSCSTPGKIGMIITGPWDLSGFPDVNYGVQVMPSFDPGGSHQTIAGPDNWVIFDNGQARVDAAWKFLSFMTSPDQVLQDSLDTSHLPTRASVAGHVGVPGVLHDVPGHAGVRGQPEERAAGATVDPAVPADLHRARPGDRDARCRDRRRRRTR